MAPKFKDLARAGLILWLLGALPLPLAAAQQGYDEHYRSALSARAAGDLDGAIGQARQALAARPDSVEALYLLGTLLAFQKSYDEALDTLHEARGLDPDNLDVRLAIARTLSWRGDHAGARRELAGLREAAPDNPELGLLEARLDYYQGRHGAAARRLESLLAAGPENAEATLLLGDVKRAQGDLADARRLYRRALELDPDSAAAARLAQLRDTPWRLDLGYEFSDFTRQPRNDWHEGLLQLRREVGRRSGVFGRLEGKERFDLWDTQLTVGGDHRFTDWLAAYAEVGGTPNADFLARWTVAGGGSARLWQGGDAVGATVLTLDTKRSDYRSGAVDTISPGAQQYFLSGRVWLTGRSINTFDENNEWTRGWLGRVDWQAHDDLALHAGLADAPETVAGQTVDTRSVFAGLVYRLEAGRSLRFDYLRDDREDSYIRHSFAFGVTQRF
ncbi:MAG: YaiO family outer membrane beta-barrel protein [Rhodospirillales bacterium]|nr:YaiO family outer membrane beta-barrel protein [Rhodospirillales bacterium]